MIKEWVVIEPNEQPVRHCIVALAGRGNTASMMASIANDFQLPNTLVVGLRPRGYAWYPMPNNAMDQDDAVAGLPAAVKAVEKRIRAIKAAWHLKNKDICLLGFSAGSVVGIQLALHVRDPFLAMVSMAGAVLEPYRIPLTDGRETQFLLQHNHDDMCFEWFERYIPMRSGLIARGYNVWTLEKNYGGHQPMARDIVSLSNHVGHLFGYEGWSHPEADRFMAIPLTHRFIENPVPVQEPETTAAASNQSFPA